jgi:hypothetical protein
MPAKKKSLARKLKVELKDLRPKKDAKAGALTILLGACSGCPGTDIHKGV